MTAPVPIDSFDAYAAQRGAALLRFAYLVCRDRSLAEDLTQEALARAYRRWNRIERSDEPDVYVRRIVLNELLSLRRRLRWGREVGVDRMPEPGGGRDLAGDQAVRDAVWRMVATLPPQQRAVLVLRHYEDLDDGRIAQILRCTPATVRAHASKASARLRSTHDLSTLAPGGTR